MQGTAECVNRYKQYEQNIYLLEEELQTLRHELKSAWEVLGHANKLRSVKELQEAKQSEKMNNKVYAKATAGDTFTPTTTIVMVTPTYERWTQKADLTRLCQTLMHIHELMWIVVEDSVNKTDLVKNLLVRCNVKYVHLNIRTPENLQLEVLWEDQLHVV